jgi:hypothetical protein
MGSSFFTWSQEVPPLDFALSFRQDLLGCIFNWNDRIIVSDTCQLEKKKKKPRPAWGLTRKQTEFRKSIRVVWVHGQIALLELRKGCDVDAQCTKIIPIQKEKKNTYVAYSRWIWRSKNIAY